MRSISTEVKRRETSSASSTSPAVGAPKLVPFAAASAIAAMTLSSQCPRMSGPHEQT